MRRAPTVEVGDATSAPARQGSWGEERLDGGLKARTLFRRVKGAQMRSCSSVVLMEESAEQVASIHSALLLLANDRQPAGLIWRL
jgi:hypothetical protein